MAAATPLILAPHPVIQPPPGPVVLIILDGVGIGPGDAYDAVAQARTPTLDALRAGPLSRQLRAHGIAVGLPSDADMGNSEVGHNILGAGRIFPQGAKVVEQAFASGSIWRGPWRDVVEFAKHKHGALHLMGLLSDGNVHSHERHLHALIRAADAAGLERVFVHVLLDGRDVPETSALIYVERLEAVLREIDGRPQRSYKIASGGGRMITTMDRYEADWSIVARGWEAHVLGVARPFPSVSTAIESLRAEQPGIGDQFLPSFTIVDTQGRPVAPIVDGDSVVFFNFRGDRAIEISRAFTEGPEFDKFDRQRVPAVLYAGMMLYDGDRGIPARYLVTPEHVAGTMGEYLAANQIRQFACSETQKYGHVTYFWNGNRSDMFDPAYEKYLEIPSDRVPFQERPWMKSAECADAVIDELRHGQARFMRVNFAAGDMVGHTGSLEAAILAVQIADLQLARILPEVEAARGTLVVTADHGNSDDMAERDARGVPLRDANGRVKPKTSHTLNPVPFVIHDGAGRSLRLRSGLDGAGLSNVAATLVELLGYRPPAEYDASLIEAV